MSRNTITQPSIVVAVNGDLLVWTEGILTGTNKEYVKEAKRISHNHFPVNLTPYGPTVVADLHDTEKPEQAMAAMLGALKGRGRILEAPEEVFEMLPPLGDPKNIY